MNSKAQEELIGYCFGQLVTVAILSLCEALIGVYTILVTPVPTSTDTFIFKDFFVALAGFFVLYIGITMCYESIQEAIELWKTEELAIKRYWKSKEK